MPTEMRGYVLIIWIPPSIVYTNYSFILDLITQGFPQNARIMYYKRITKAEVVINQKHGINIKSNQVWSWNALNLAQCLV